MIKNDKYPYGLFAGRKFSKEDVIGIYLGEYNPILSKEDDPDVPSTDNVYTLDDIDAKCGMYGECFMGLHLCNDPCLLENDDTSKKIE